MVNRVLPHLNVDYVSYSAYDLMQCSAERIREIIAAIQAALQPKEGIPTPRIWIGEIGMPQEMCGDGEAHARVNLDLMRKLLDCPVMCILYWQIYCNERNPDGTCRGFWLIDDQNRETPLYRALEALIAEEKQFALHFKQTQNRLPTSEEHRQFLLSIRDKATCGR